MVIRLVLSIIACVATAVDSRAAESDEPAPRARAARFYAAGLELPLLEMRKGALLLQICRTRLRGACSREQRRAARNRTVALFDELTLFPQLAAMEPPARVTKDGDLREQIVVTSAALMHAAGEYDRALIARYGAALRTCPGDSDIAYGESLEALTTIVLRDFQGLEGTDYDAARHALADAETQAAAALRALPDDDCRAALTLGQLLMEMMSAKLRPWTPEYRRVANADQELNFEFDAASRAARDAAPSYDFAIAVEGSFVAMVATELQLTVFPETAPRIRAIAEAEDAARAD
jgi:hypothetical protein